MFISTWLIPQIYRTQEHKTTCAQRYGTEGERKKKYTSRLGKP